MSSFCRKEGRLSRGFGHSMGYRMGNYLGYGNILVSGLGLSWAEMAREMVQF